MGRARGGETAHASGHGKGRTGQSRADVGHGDVEEPAPPALQRPEAGVGGRQAGERVGDGIAAEQWIPASPDDETAGGARIVAERNPVGRSTGAPVAGDGDPHPGASVPYDVLGLESQLPQGPRTAGFDHDVGPPDQPVQRPDPLRAPQVERDRTFATVQAGRRSPCAPRRAPSGRCGRLDLHDVCARLGQEVAAERAGPQRREVEHQ